MKPSERDTRYERIRMRTSPVFQRRDMGPRYFIRLAVLVALAAALAWYSRHPRTNPFSPESTVHIRGDSSICTITVDPGDSRPTVIVLPRSTIDSSGSPIRTPPGQWHLITRKTSEGFALRSRCTSVPSRWTVITQAAADTASPLPGSAGRLRPVHGESFVDDNTMRLFAGGPPGSHNSVLVIYNNETVMLVADSLPAFSDSVRTRQWKEKTDVIVLLHATESEGRTARNLLRPRFLVALSRSPATRTGVSGNILRASPSGFAYSFVRRRGETVLADSH